MYSAVDQFRKQFAQLEENGGKSGASAPLERKHVSLPRYICVSLLSPLPFFVLLALLHVLCVYFSFEPFLVVDIACLVQLQVYHSTFEFRLAKGATKNKQL